MLGAAAAIAVLGGVIWAFTQGGSDSTEPRPTGDQVAPSTTVEQPAPPPSTVQPPPPPPSERPTTPPRTTPRGCFPFQPDC
ncbi:hypothetical protein [Nocardia noduli]|uniref:hypothetical protein n=1 Tax=Nocardia noduli TaxID=2815722 RepID=UPI001C21EBD8|nr:hypothetical protein [Nocardia noduli]